jgi:hypothetical protein
MPENYKTLGGVCAIRFDIITIQSCVMKDLYLFLILVTISNQISLGYLVHHGTTRKNHDRRISAHC